MKRLVCKCKAPWVLLIVGVEVMMAPAAARAEEAVEGDGETPAEVAPYPARRVLTLIRFAPGFFVTPGQAEGARFDCDVSVTLRINLTRRRAFLSLMPDVGYTYHNGDVVGGHYGTLGLGLRYGTDWIAGSPMAAVLLGERGDQFDVGVRAGFRIYGALDLVGLEVAYEYRTQGDDGVDLHGVRFVVILDIGVVFAPTMLTRLGYSFGRGN
jgi:hypothetical protein